jgi:alpha/beta superfamily hydrolase
MLRLSSFTVGFAIGAWVGAALGRHRPRTDVAAPAHPFTYTDTTTWQTIPAEWPISWSYTSPPKH